MWVFLLYFGVCVCVDFFVFWKAGASFWLPGTVSYIFFSTCKHFRAPSVFLSFTMLVHLMVHKEFLMSFPLTVLYVFTFGGTIPNDISSTSTIVSCTLPRLLLNVPFQCCNLSLCYFCVVFLYFLSLLKCDLYMCYFSDLGEHCNTVNISKTFTG